MSQIVFQKDWFAVFKVKITVTDNILKGHISITVSLTVTLNLKTANQSFSETIWLIMMQHHTKFGGKNFSDSEGQTFSH